MSAKHGFQLMVLGVVAIMAAGCSYTRTHHITEGNYTTSSIAYPTGRTSTSNLLLEKSYPKTIRLGQQYDYTIKVTNISDLELNGIKVSERIPEGFQLSSANPQISEKSGGQSIWDLGDLKPKESRSIIVTGEADLKQDLPCCTNAQYSTAALCLNTAVTKPGLELSLSVPSKILVCDQANIEFEVKNTGDNSLDNVVINSELPQGVTGARGENTLKINAGSLGIGQSRSFSQRLNIANHGNYVFQATAMADEDISSNTSEGSLEADKPALQVVVKSAKETAYVGRDVAFNVMVKNASAVESTNTMVAASVPSIARVKSASDNGSTSGHQVRWDIGTLAAGDSKELQVVLTGEDAGKVGTEVSASGSCADTTTDSASSNFIGISALLLEVVDENDPLEVGGEENYEIKVTNQGSAQDSNIRIVAELETGMSFVSADGPTQANASGNKVVFDSLQKLDAKMLATWHLKIKFRKAGDLRFKATMTSDQLDRPVEETEATRAY